MRKLRNPEPFGPRGTDGLVAFCDDVGAGHAATKSLQERGGNATVGAIDPRPEDAMTKLMISTLPDRSKVEITLDDVLRLDAAQLESFIENLLEARLALLPERQNVDPFPGTRMISHPGMRWFAAPEQGDTGRVQMALIHPGLGPLGMILEEVTVHHLMVVLAQCLPSRLQRPQQLPEDGQETAG